MFFAMIFAGVLSTMNIWVDKWSDMRLSINDFYMILLMTGWMFLFMGVWYAEWITVWLGGVLVCAMLWCIRTQFLVDMRQFVLGMIPHHSMAIHMSRKLIQKNTALNAFAKDIMEQQQREITFMKST